MSAEKNKVIIAPLNWGLGHATRCIPIVKKLLAFGFTPVIASNGKALILLQKEFPELEFLKLPSYGIRYHKVFALGMFLSIPSIVLGILEEHSFLKKYIKEHGNEVCGIISDNRLGFFHNQVKSVYITHQLNIQAGWLSKIINSTHHFFIKKHKICWVPDEVGSLFTGNLSKSIKMKVVFVGVLSRFQFKKEVFKYDLLVLLSGIEQQRKSLEDVLVRELKNYSGKVLFVRGVFSSLNKLNLPENMKVVDYLLSQDLENAINSSKMVLSRSGYSTVMDLIKLKKTAFLIPTPGQTEQEFLGSYLSKKKIFSSCTQQYFDIEKLKNTNQFIDKESLQIDLLDKEILSFFQSKKES